MNKKSLAIGVFDSGMGGLTVLKALKATLPLESFIYLGDTARLPYGTKSLATVQKYAEQMAKILVRRQIKALVIACNTATTAALDHLTAMMPELLIIGVIQPGAKAAIKATNNGKIIVLATETTIHANAYQQIISQTLPKAEITAIAANVLVGLAEAGMNDNLVAKAALEHYLKDKQAQDTLILGCTHFPVFTTLLEQMHPELTIVDSAQATAEVLKNLLIEQQLLTHKALACTTQYLVTDSVKRFQQLGALFLDEPIELQAIELIDYS